MVCEEVWMERCVRFHRFGVLLFIGLALSPEIYARTPVVAEQNAQPRLAQNLPAPAAPPQTQTAATPAAQQTKSGEYVLSQDRYEKAVTYSRAAYTMYFVSVLLNVLALLFLLRLGIAAKFRNWAETVSDRRWIQALIFVPLLVFSVDLAALPLRLYGHVLSLRYEMSVQNWGSWLSDWTKEQLLMVGLDRKSVV
jgi:hypothetical protein